MKKTLKILTRVFIIILAIILTLFIYNRLTINNKYKIGEKNLKIPIFVYHDIVDSKDEVQCDYMQTTYETFKKQINGMINLGYKPISYIDLLDYANGKKELNKKSFLITFDDGYDGVYKYAYEFAKEKNIPISSFLINDKVGSPGYYTWDEAKEMDKSNLVGIYSHSLKHDEYNKYSPNDLLNDTEESIKDIESKLGHSINKVYTYPYGLYSKEGKELLKEKGFAQNLTDNKINQSKKLDIYGLHRMYPLNDPVWKIILKIEYRTIKYG